MRDVTMRTALTKSLNVVTVDLAMQTGLRASPRWREFRAAERPPYPSLALGTSRRRRLRSLRLHRVSRTAARALALVRHARR
jgi:membrane peptidoglycan carboxypeptidase